MVEEKRVFGYGIHLHEPGRGEATDTKEGTRLRPGRLLGWGEKGIHRTRSVLE